MQKAARSLAFSLLEGTFAVARLPPDTPEPSWAGGSEFSCVTRTADELSVVCEESRVPAGVQKQEGWRCLKLHGPFDLTETGIAAAFVGPLAQAGVPVFVISTFDTDYLLLAAADLERALAVLQASGHRREIEN